LGVGAAGGVGLAIAIPFIVGTAYVNQYTTGIGFAVVVASLGLLLWTSGQISLCQMAFAAVGATTFAHALGAGWPWLVALVAAVVVAIGAGAIAAIPSFRLSGVYLAVATFGFGLLVQNLIFPTFLMFGRADSVTINRPHLFGLSLVSDRAYYFLALIVAVLCAGVVVGVRRSRLGRLLRGLSDSAAALEAHGTDTRITRLYVFCISAGIAAVGGVLIAGVTQHAGGTAAGPFGYFNSVVLLAILAFSGSQPLVSPAIAAFTFAVLRVYRPFNGAWFAKYEGVFFGALAIAVAVAPGIKMPGSGRRTAEREGCSPVAARGRVSLRAPQLSPLGLESHGIGGRERGS
jgi:ABC-type branched-subunit amino acid transport system permease subunit